MTNQYTDKSIKTMRPLEAIRRRLGMYISGNDNDAAHHVVKEIISNSIDEFINGHGNLIQVEVNEAENWVSVRDYGRGIPHGKMNDAFTKVHTSGKLKGENEGAYAASGGLNGIGGKVATATGRVDLISIREGKEAINWYHYEDMGKINITASDKKAGTYVKWKPDDNVFTDNQLYAEKIKELLVTLSYIAAGLTFELKYEGEVESISAKGIEYFLKDNINEKKMYSPIMKFSCGDSFLHIDAAMVWANAKNIESSFVNFIPTFEGGTHITALKTVLTRELNKFLDSSLKGGEVREGWSYIVSIKTSEEPTFKGQQKSAVNMPELNLNLSRLYKDEITMILSQYESFFEKLKEVIMKAREKEKAVAKVREVLSKTKRKNNPLPAKLKPALNKKGAELFITEGDSASGSLVVHRDIYKHAIMSLKGKPINVRKAPLEKSLDNQEIQDLIIAMGGFGENYSTKQCPYDKIFLLADSDSDGSHIQNLLITFFFEFYPQLIEEGKLYTIKTPLYTIKNGNKIEYVFSESEMENKRKSLGKSCTVSRNKGLGELQPEILSDLAFGKSREIIPLNYNNYDLVEELIEQLMGKNAAQRKEIVEGE